MAALPESQGERIRALVQNCRSIGQCAIESVPKLAEAGEKLRHLARRPGLQLLVTEAWTGARDSTGEIIRLHAAYPRLTMIILSDQVAARESELRRRLGPQHRLLFLDRSFRSFYFDQLLRIVLRATAAAPLVPSVNLPAEKGRSSFGEHLAEHEVDAAQSRWAFEREVGQALQDSLLTGKPSAICIFGIDRFHAMLDRLGAAAQSSVLRQVRCCIDDTMQQHHRLLRIGEDEFGLLLLHTTAEEALSLADGALNQLRKAHLQWRGVDIPLTVSAGVTDTSREENAVPELLLAADTALQAARSCGGDRSRLYHSNDSVLVSLKEQSRLLSEIEAALAEGRFKLLAQLIVPTESREPISAEILLRMIDRSGSLIPPGKFLLAAERFGIAPRIDRWVVDHALSALAAWGPNPDRGHISINLSGRTLMDAATLEWIEARFKEAALPPDSVCFEITETAAVDRWSVAAPFVDRLRALGALFSLDDFGAGFSSFTYLESVPADFLKIDGSFIRQCTSNARRLALVKSLNEIGHLFGKRTVAEFVEDQETLRAVTALGVNYAQGYFSGVPFPAENIAAVIATHQLTRCRVT